MGFMDKAKDAADKFKNSDNVVLALIPRCL